MNRTRYTSFLFGLVGLLVFARGVRAEESFGPLTRAEQARIDQGDIVVQVDRTADDLRSFRAVGRIKAPAERVYAAFTDFEHYATIFQIKEARVVNRQGNRLWVRAVLTLPWPFGDRWVVNETVLAPEERSFSYQRLQGTILRYEGTLRVLSVGPSLSQVYYAAKGDPGLPLVPDWLLNFFQSRLLPSSIQRVRDHLAS